jgi:hypothetical protein
LARIWTDMLAITLQRKSPDMPNPGEQPDLAARMRAGGLGRDRTADTTAVTYGVRREPVSRSGSRRLAGVGWSC